jgi:hypothetical protein
MKFFGSIIYLFLIGLVMATPQWPDSMLYENTKIDVFGFRLPKPYKNDTEMEWILSMGSTCSACWRGYVAGLELRGKDLVLVSLDTQYFSDKRATPLKLVGSEIPKGGLLASWFTGKLFFPFGSSYGYLHNSEAGDQRSKEKVFEFKQGKLIKIDVIDKEKPDELVQKKEFEKLQKTNKANHVIDPTRFARGS